MQIHDTAVCMHNATLCTYSAEDCMCFVTNCPTCHGEMSCDSKERRSQTKSIEHTLMILSI
jgi:hypothetical protein